MNNRIAASFSNNLDAMLPEEISGAANGVSGLPRNHVPHETASGSAPAGIGSRRGLISPDGFIPQSRDPHPGPLPRGEGINPPARGEGSECGTVEAHARAGVCREFLRLTEVEGFSLNMAAAALGKSPSWFSGSDSPLARYRREGVAGLLPRRGQAGTKAGDLTGELEGLGWFVPAARFFYLLTNRTWKSGSVPEAVRRAISLPNVPVGWKAGDVRRLLRAIPVGVAGRATDFPLGVTDRPHPGPLPRGEGRELDLPICPVELRERILARERAGLPLVPERIARQITVSPSVVRQHRNPTEAALDYLCAPGGLRLIRNEQGPRLARAGEIVEADDATINFPVCVPWTLGGDACGDKFGVRVGRFQWLVAICAGTSFVPGFSYTARPRSSYRGEDILSLMRIVCKQHGVPRQWRLERGAWKSKLVTGAISAMGSSLETVYSPHQKPFIEGLFNTLWTKLSVQFPNGQVGRFMGEEEAGCDLLTACQRGQKDPRRYFPMLNDAIGAFQEVLAEKNRTPVNSKHHGRWVPEERWAAEVNEHVLPRMDAGSSWVFSPFVREWKIKGALAGGRIPIFEEFSVPFDFSAPWMPEFDGARCKFWFDPSEPRCHATVTLAQDFAGKKAGTVLGRAGQVNETAGYVRLVMGWGDDPASAGRLARQAAASAMRREVRAVMPTRLSLDPIKGKALAESEERDGVSRVARVETGTGGLSGVADRPHPCPLPRGEGMELASATAREMVPLVPEFDALESI